ncbi:MAG: glutamine-hydrolyzing carbamoyl-phosphate synthase small subunit [Spirochaetaceae bacterium]|nr:glutamine-hydrolyzing carbamoyl-phosphate synthase small subunit [Spirochaetaceae bacterium]
MMKAWLILADGTIFEGTSIGKTGRTTGETVFTTGMTGYLETLTDPSYFGQIVTQTFPLIGNYGVIPQDFESRKCHVRGYVVRELCNEPSNFRCGGILNDFLKTQGIIGICGIDTRALTKKLRESGVMNGMIISGEEKCPDVTDALLKEIKDYKIVQAVESVQSNTVIPPLDGGICTSQPVADCPVKPDNDTNGNVTHHIVLWDFGAKANIQRELEKRGCKVTVVSCGTSADQILALKPDGLMLSNGPGDPADNTQIIEEIRKICDFGKLPVFGICLGHQMLALARGAKTSKLKYGHRGGNHPVKDTATNRVYITSQNHGYAVEADTLPSFATMSFFNVNDNTCEGVRYNDIPAFSVQFHPEACGGPHDTNFLFDEFLSML